MLAIIPARGGSKGVPQKNIKPLLGRPLIEYTIRAALKAKSIKRIILSTDDKQIARVAEKFPVDIPFMRPKRLATDRSLAKDVYLYTIDRLRKKEGVFYDSFVILQPTSPLRTERDIDQAVSIFKERKADSVISVCPAPYPPVWARLIDTQGRLKYYFPQQKGLVNRQQLKEAHIPNGAVYVLKYNLLTKNSYLTANSYPYIMPRERSIDIDDMIDFRLAEYYLKIRKNFNTLFGKV